jgi:hypothetical protein
MPTRAASVRTVLGALLLVAAGLKLFALSGAGTSTAAVPELGWFAQPWVQLLVAEWELLLGAWLLSGVYARASWLAALVTFGAFALVSGYFGWVGVASCGCLGAVQTNPWWMFGVDVAAVALLAVSRPATSNRPGFTLTLGTCVCLAAFILLVSAWHGSLQIGLAKLRGETVAITPSYYDFGDTQARTELTHTVSIHNFASSPLRVIGGTHDCVCVTTEQLPLLVPAQSTTNLTIAFTPPPGQAGRYYTTAKFWTDRAEAQIEVRLSCTILQPSSR